MKPRTTLTLGVCLLGAALAWTLTPAAFAQSQEMIDAAEKGDAAAQIRLGYAFRDGRGAGKNYEKSFQWFNKAAEQGNMEAVDNLGWLIEHGMGTPKDEAKARTLYLKAAQQKHPQAINNLARCLREGIGGPADANEALKWRITAFQAKPGPETANELAKQLLGLPSLAEHRALIDQLGEVKSHNVLLSVARVYDEGLGGIAKDPQKARDYFAKARQHGMPKEMFDATQLEEMAKRPRVKGEFAYMPTVHMDQGYNMCGPTAAAMALEFYLGKPVDPYAIKRNSRGATQPGTGTAWDFMLHGIKAVSGHEWEFRSWPNNDAGFDQGLPVLLAELDAGRIALIDLGPHTVVLAGYNAKEQVVYVQNPAYCWPGVHAVSYDNLRGKWHSPWHVSTTKGVEARPALLTADSARKKQGTLR